MRKRILVVEDDPDICRMIAMALADDGGFQVVTAATRELAYGECLTADPDVIVLDLHLAGGSDDEGAVFLRDYRARGGRARVVVVSGLNHAEALTRGLGVEEYVGKPFDVDLLMRSVQRALPA